MSKQPSKPDEILKWIEAYKTPAGSEGLSPGTSLRVLAALELVAETLDEDDGVSQDAYDYITCGILAILRDEREETKQ